jgi:hypothetical protein
MKKHKIRWRIHKRSWKDRWGYQTSAWAMWYVGMDFGWWGLGVVREQWGWRIMLGTIHLCGHIED